jgi:uncharacterized delta-60 repeat protein
MRQRGHSSAGLEQLERRTLFGAGDPDTTFNGTQAIDGIDGVSYVIPAADGKVVVVGTLSGDGFTLTRANVDGTRDTAFGQQGLVTAQTLPGLSIPFVIGTAAHLDSGKFALLCREGMAGDAGVAMFNADGSLDSTFAEGGVWPADLGIEHIEFQSDGKLLYAGTVRINQNSRRAVVRRLNADGTPDTTFGAGGEVALATASRGSAMEVRSDDGLYVSLETLVFEAASGGFVGGSRIFRLTEDGGLRPGLGQASFVDTPNETTLELGVMPDNSVVHLSEDGSGNARLRSYDVLGRVRAEFFGEDVRQADRMIVDAEGRVIVMHSAIDAGIVETHISRLFDDALGADTGYGIFGTAKVPGRVNDAAIHDGDGLVLVPVQNNGSENLGSLVRLQGGGGIRAQLDARGTLNVRTDGVGARTSVWVRGRDGRMVVRYGDDNDEDFAKSFAPSRVKRIYILLDLGPDELTIGRGVKGVFAEANSGDDTMHGGPGDDTLGGGDGDDEISGNDGNDRPIGGPGDDTVFGGAGNDRLFGFDGIDHLDGGDGDDYFEGGWGDDRIAGGAGNDTWLHEIEGADDILDSIETTLEEQPA